MKKALHAAIESTRGKTAIGEHVQDVLMDFFAVDAVANLLVADSLSRLDRRIDFLGLVRGAPAHHRPAQVADIAVVLRAWKDVEDDRGVGLDRTAAFMVRIDALIA